MSWREHGECGAGPTRPELARKVLEGEIISLDDLNSVLRSMIKDGVETAMGAEMTGFLGAPTKPTVLAPNFFLGTEILG